MTIRFILTFCILSLVGTNAQAGLFGNDKQDNAETKTPLITAPLQPSSFADLAERLIPAVVNISSTTKIAEAVPYEQFEDLMPQFPEGSPFGDFFEHFMQRPFPGSPLNRQSIPASSLGSGFIIDAEQGYIITNNHVIKNADEVRVTLPNDESVKAEVIGTDEKTDLAVLKIDPKGHDLKDVTLGNSDDIRVGDWILAIGNPFGLGGTVTAGIISARARDINSGPYDDYLQTDASINRGNSGGPMFNLAGEVIGINTAIFSPTGGSVGIGFAIPSSQAKPVIDQLIEFGQTRRGWLGVRIQSVTEEIAESLGLDKARGALVASVTEGGPAQAAGIEAGDIILEFAGQPIDEMRELPRIVAETRIESEVKIKVLSKGDEKTLTVKVGELEKAEKNGMLGATQTSDSTYGTTIDPLGITVDEITSVLRDEYAIPENIQNGVIITDIDPEAEAAQKGLIAGDIVTEINQKPLTTPDDFINAVNDAKEKKRSSILLLINREGDVRFVALKIDSEE